jgi:hypothetical protein
VSSWRDRRHSNLRLARSQISAQARAGREGELTLQFALSEIAVMRKEDGHAVFVRPDTYMEPRYLAGLAD